MTDALGALEKLGEQTEKRRALLRRATVYYLNCNLADAQGIEQEVRAALAEATAGQLAECERAKRLECCGNCGHHDIRHEPYGEGEEECDHFTDYEHDQTHDWPEGKYAQVQSYHHCHFTPSSWTERSPE